MEIFNSKSKSAGVIKDNPNPNFVPPAHIRTQQEIYGCMDIETNLSVLKEILKSLNKLNETVEEIKVWVNNYNL